MDDHLLAGALRDPQSYLADAARAFLPSLPRNRFHASIYCENLCPFRGVRFNDKLPSATSNGMMYHKSSGTR